MTHKVHPKAFRIRGLQDFNARGFYGKKMPQYLEEDFVIKDFFSKNFSEASIAVVITEHSNNGITVIVETARPGVLIGRGGQGIEQLKKNVERELVTLHAKKAPQKKAEPLRIKIEIKEIKNPWISAPLVADWAAKQIEKRIPFKQVLKRGMERVMQNKEAKGIKMEVSGRLNGIEIARKEWLKQGRMPLQSIRAVIEYYQTEAHCTYGAVGVKVWIYKGDSFE